LNSPKCSNLLDGPCNEPMVFHNSHWECLSPQNHQSQKCSMAKSRKMENKCCQNETMCLLVDLPLIWRTIVATFTAAMLKFQCHLKIMQILQYQQKSLSFWRLQRWAMRSDVQPQRHLLLCVLFHQIPFVQHIPVQNHLYPTSFLLYIQGSSLLEPVMERIHIHMQSYHHMGYMRQTSIYRLARSYCIIIGKTLYLSVRIKLCHNCNIMEFVQPKCLQVPRPCHMYFL